MKRIQMKALVSMVYGGKRYSPGADVPVRTQSDARLLAAIGRAELVPVPAPVAPPPAVASAPERKKNGPPIPPQPVETHRPVPTEAPATPDPTPPAAPAVEPAEKPKRTYRRRDMDAESGSNES